MAIAHNQPTRSNHPAHLDFHAGPARVIHRLTEAAYLSLEKEVQVIKVPKDANESAFQCGVEFVLRAIRKEIVTQG